MLEKNSCPLCQFLNHERSAVLHLQVHVSARARAFTEGDTLSKWPEVVNVCNV